MHISNLNFDRFIQEQAWAVEDEAAFRDDAARAEEQRNDYQNELTEITEVLMEMDEWTSYTNNVTTCATLAAA